MSSANELQQLIRDTLTADAAIMAIANDVYDRVPPEPFGDKTAYVSFGASDGTEDDADEIDGIEVTRQIDIWSRAVGSVECQSLTDLVRRALHRSGLALSQNALCDMWVTLWRVSADPDGLTTHGVVQITAMIEES